MATYSLNYEQNGVEIYFDTKPNSTVLEDLKRNGWHWNGKKKVWYKKQSAESIAFAKKLCNQNNVAPTQTNTVSFSFTDSSSKKHKVSIEKTKTGYKVTSATNMILCVDCKKIYSVHALACPFCGCPLNYTAERDYNEYLNTKQVLAKFAELEASVKKINEGIDKLEKKAKEEKERKEKEQLEREAQQKAREERERKEIARYERQRNREILKLCDEFSEVASKGNVLTPKNSGDTKMCIGNCSVCNRNKCVEDI